jgi:hypothetical protein
MTVAGFESREKRHDISQKVSLLMVYQMETFNPNCVALPSFVATWHRHHRQALFTLCYTYVEIISWKLGANFGSMGH